MADVQSTATLTLNVVGEDKVKSLASSLNEIKSSAGETASSVGQSFSNIEQSAKGAETRLKKLDELSYRAPRPGEAGFEEERAKHEAWMAQVEERSAARKRERPGGAFAAEPMPMATGLQSAAEATAYALVGLGAAAVAAGAAMKLMETAGKAAMDSAREVSEVQTTAARSNLSFEEARQERLAGVGLFGEAGFRRVQDRLERSVREGGKGLTKDLEAIGVSREEARPTPTGLARAAVARRAELARAIQEAPTEEARAAAQATMNTFTSALVRRAGPDMLHVAETESEASLRARTGAAEKTAAAFQRNITAQQEQEAASRQEAAAAESKGVWSRMWESFGSAATPGVTQMTEGMIEYMRKAAPPVA